MTGWFRLFVIAVVIGAGVGLGLLLLTWAVVVLRGH